MVEDRALLPPLPLPDPVREDKRAESIVDVYVLPIYVLMDMVTILYLSL